mmetsp:Transcript_14590/g.63195  ORF Transcript_14590/g.63195 Transcript_14590/m.63195 type:complete len:399 (+) Transcript_14590:912-2108(+)
MRVGRLAAVRLAPGRGPGGHLDHRRGIGEGRVVRRVVRRLPRRLRDLIRRPVLDLKLPFPPRLEPPALLRVLAGVYLPVGRVLDPPGPRPPTLGFHLVQPTRARQVSRPLLRRLFLLLPLASLRNRSALVLILHLLLLLAFLPRRLALLLRGSSPFLGGIRVLRRVAHDVVLEEKLDSLELLVGSPSDAAARNRRELGRFLLGERRLLEKLLGLRRRFRRAGGRAGAGLGRVRRRFLSIRRHSADVDAAKGRNRRSRRRAGDGGDRPRDRRRRDARTARGLGHADAGGGGDGVRGGIGTRRFRTVNLRNPLGGTRRLGRRGFRLLGSSRGRGDRDRGDPGLPSHLSSLRCVFVVGARGGVRALRGGGGGGGGGVVATVGPARPVGPSRPVGPARPVSP